MKVIKVIKIISKTKTITKLYQLFKDSYVKNLKIDKYKKTVSFEYSKEKVVVEKTSNGYTLESESPKSNLDVLDIFVNIIKRFHENKEKPGIRYTKCKVVSKKGNFIVSRGTPMEKLNRYRNFSSLNEAINFCVNDTAMTLKEWELELLGESVEEIDFTKLVKVVDQVLFPFYFPFFKKDAIYFISSEDLIDSVDDYLSSPIGFTIFDSI